MKTITISQVQFDKLFDVCRDKLKLATFEKSALNRFSQLEIEDLHRTFNYHICALKDEIEKAQ